MDCSQQWEIRIRCVRNSFHWHWRRRQRSTRGNDEAAPRTQNIQTKRNEMSLSSFCFRLFLVLFRFLLLGIFFGSIFLQHFPIPFEWKWFRCDCRWRVSVRSHFFSLFNCISGSIFSELFARLRRWRIISSVDSKEWWFSSDVKRNDAVTVVDAVWHPCNRREFVFTRKYSGRFVTTVTHSLSQLWQVRSAENCVE